jgi:hypothetical protein
MLFKSPDENLINLSFSFFIKNIKFSLSKGVTIKSNFFLYAYFFQSKKLSLDKLSFFSIVT